MSDAALVLRARGGDELAFRRLLDRYEGLLRTICAKYFLPGGDSGDLRQVARLGFHEAVLGYQGNAEGCASFRNFAALCVRREVVQAVKSATAQKHGPLNESVSMHTPIAEVGNSEAITLADTSVFTDPKADTVDRLQRGVEVGAVVGTVTERLSPLERAATVGIAEGVPYEVIAAEEGCDVKRIDNAAQRGKHKIREALERAA